MRNEFEILKPNIFPENKIISGVTKRNRDLFPGTGFSISKGEILSDIEVGGHRMFLAEQLDFPLSNLKFQKQVHKTDIQIVNKDTPNEKETDGMITKENSIILNITIADCTAILVFDPIMRIIAALHSGWRGTKENIAAKGIKLLKSNYNSNPADLLVYLSPCASGERYEVGWDVAKYFPDSVKRINDEKYLFDNRKQILIQLEKAGVRIQNIEASDICTIENNDYHSFRRDKENSGRMAAFIGLITND